MADEADAMPENDPSTHSAEIVEGETLETKPLASPAGSGFTHFLDGIQMSRMIFTWREIPIVWGYYSACVRRRGEDGLMQTGHCLCKREEALFVPFNLISPDERASWGLLCQNTTPLTGEAPQLDDHPGVIRQLAKKALDKRRDEMERDLMRAWAAVSKDDEWLLVDGSLSQFFRGGGHERMVGVIKSHQARYFSGDDYRKILKLEAESRTSAFQPRRTTLQPVYSWYLRLRPNHGQDQTFGLIRIEVSPTEELKAMADDLSRWALAERTPLSLPDHRWDRMIYPIRDCEQYLRAIAPSKVEVAARISF